MSLTVSQLLELPCLRRAKVLAGHRSLDRIVTSISVLEYSTPTETQKKLYESIEFWGSELVITGFCNVANDVDAQCANIRSMERLFGGDPEHKLLRLLDLTPLRRDVADPWYTRDFNACWDDIVLGCRALLECLPG